jgi:hypothetical protein
MIGRHRELALEGGDRLVEAIVPAERDAMHIIVAGLIGSAARRILEPRQSVAPAIGARMLDAARMAANSMRGPAPSSPRPMKPGVSVIAQISRACSDE